MSNMKIKNQTDEAASDKQPQRDIQGEMLAFSNIVRLLTPYSHEERVKILRASAILLDIRLEGI